MTQTNTTRGYALAKDEGLAIWTMGERMTMKATQALTGNAFTLIEDLVAPGGEPPPHLHENEDEAYYILDGEMDVTIGDQTFHARPGSFVFLPRLVPHHWKVVGAAPVRFLVFFVPSGIEGFFLALGEPARTTTPPPPPSGPPDMEKIVRTAGQYGMRLAGPPPSA
jgi:quercetin dioxygenase-like cupin family protein